jgi:hypothetical protein
MIGTVVVIVVAALAGVACVVWFFVTRNPEQAAGHEGDPVPRDIAAGRSLAGPADAGAEDERPPLSQPKSY